jgi:hypothetical protein
MSKKKDEGETMDEEPRKTRKTRKMRGREEASEGRRLSKDEGMG